MLYGTAKAVPSQRVVEKVDLERGGPFEAPATKVDGEGGGQRGRVRRRVRNGFVLLKHVLFYHESGVLVK